MLDVQISSPEIDLSDAMRSAIRDQIVGLKTHAGPGNELEACHVVVARPAGPGRNHPYQVRVHASMPGREFNATHHEHLNYYQALAKAFEALRRQLCDFEKSVRGHHFTANAEAFPGKRD